MKTHLTKPFSTASCVALALMLTVVFSSGCASQPTFVDQPVVWHVDDQRNIEPPDRRRFYPELYFANVFVIRQLTRFLELRSHQAAQNTNALDEVPNSTWFTNRLGVRDLTPEEAAIGPAQSGPPVLPISIIRGKGAGGGNPGFFVEDATGRVFLVKFDTKANPEMQTATSVIVNRIFWSAGYNVPSDTIFNFTRDDLMLSLDATVEDDLGNDIPMTWEHVDLILNESPVQYEGGYRASASEFLSGIPMGGWPMEGTRSDDPNDLVDHENRRELRGLRVLAAWVSHTDMKEDNTLDMYVEEDGRHFLRHYLVDFGEAMGSHQAEKQRLEDGWEYTWDWRNQGLGLLSLGLWVRPWEYQENTIWPAVGAFSAEWFEPELWREAYPYFPFDEADAADLYWGARLVMRFDRDLIEAVVATGELSDSSASDYLVEVLLERQRRIGEVWLEGVTPLDWFEMRDGELCMTDLGRHYGLVGDSVVERLPDDFRPQFDDHDADANRRVEEFPVSPEGEVCVPIDQGGDYTINRLRVRRGHQYRPIMQIHTVGGGDARILGVIRVE